jgi:transposase
MATEMELPAATIGAEVTLCQEVPMVRRERWEEIRRLWVAERVPIAEIARRLDLDRKTVRRCLRDTAWRPYHRPGRPETTLLTAHAEYLRERAEQVDYSAQILFQELRQRGYRGSYETVKLFVRPLRAVRLAAERALIRFETPPGRQSQIDWGWARVPFRHTSAVRHIFVLTLGFSRRRYYQPCLNEALPQFLDAHEHAFEYFGGHTREHLYDRPRTVCQGTAEGRVLWNSTFRSFADYWGFEPRLCQPYRAQTKGKVESGVKYFRRNFLPGRTFVDDVDLDEQLRQWMTEIADQRIHGTTHERPIDRFGEEHRHLVSTAGHPSFRLEARQPRVVAEDYLVSFETNRYSVPFTLIGQAVEVLRGAGRLLIFHRGTVVAEHPELAGKYQLRILPEHGPGAIARTARRVHSSRRALSSASTPFAEVEVRDLAVYDTLLRPGSGDTDIATLPPIVAPGGTERLVPELARVQTASSATMHGVRA